MRVFKGYGGIGSASVLVGCSPPTRAGFGALPRGVDSLNGRLQVKGNPGTLGL